MLGRKWDGLRERPSERMTFELTQKDNRVTAAGRVLTSQGKFLFFFLFFKNNSNCFSLF